MNEHGDGGTNDDVKYEHSSFDGRFVVRGGGAGLNACQVLCRLPARGNQTNQPSLVETDGVNDENCDLNEDTSWHLCPVLINRELVGWSWEPISVSMDRYGKRA